MPISGGCLCGATRYECSSEAGPAGYCHCSDCRQVTGSAFNVSVRIEARTFRIVCGQPKGFTKLADSGRELTRHFCTECGSPLFTASPHHPDYLYVKAGSLDDPTLVKPAHQSWMASRVAWAEIDPALPATAKD